MAKFTAYYNLCSIHDTKEFLGLSNDSEEGSVIITLGKNIIKIIKLSTQNLIRSWTTQDKLSFKVVYDKKSEQYVGIFNNRYIRCWYADTTDINKMKKIKFHKKILEVISSDLLDEVLFIYQDGSCESLSNAIESRKDVGNNPSTVLDLQNQSVENLSVFRLRDGRKILTYFLRNDKENTVELVITFLTDDNIKSIESTKYLLNRQGQGVSLAGYTVVDGQGFPSLFTIWSDKRIFMMPLKDVIPAEDLPGNFVSILNMFKVDSPLSIIGISSHCVAIYGANSAQEGASLILYNTQFKVIKVKQFFKIYFNFSRLWVADNHILLAMGQNLSFVTYRVSKEHLSELVGTQISTDSNNELMEVSHDFINEEDILEEDLCLSSSQPNEQFKSKLRKSNDLRQMNLLNQKIISADSKDKPYIPYDIFEDDFRKMCNENNLNIELVSIDSEDNINKELKVEIMTNYNDTGFVIKQIHMLAKALEQSGASEQEITEKLIHVLINVKDNNDDSIIDDIMTCLRKYTYISERALTKILKHTLNCFTTETINNYAELKNCSTDKLKSSDSFKLKQFRLLNVILSCSFDSDNLSIYIRKELNFNHILILIKHFYNIYCSLENHLEERPETSIDFDEDYIIMKWFNLILCTHFQQLALSRDIELLNLFMKWLEELNSFKDDMIKLCGTFHLLHQLINGKLDYKNKTYSKWYSIEEVKLY